MAFVILGGLVTLTLLNLFVLPTFYYAVMKGVALSDPPSDDVPTDA